MPEYTLLAGLSVLLVVLLEVRWLRTGIFRRAQFWLAMAIVCGFQVLVDGWLTKLSDPIVFYDDSQTLGVRLLHAIPIEDFLFGFSLVTATIALWVRLGRTRGRYRVGAARGRAERRPVAHDDADRLDSRDPR